MNSSKTRFHDKIPSTIGIGLTNMNIGRTNNNRNNNNNKNNSGASNNKKKFGKNLNKLVQQPTPPPISGLNSRSSIRNNNNSSGSGNLVLLSTNKKSSSSVLDSGGGGNGVASTSTSTHDALVHALEGKNDNTSSSSSFNINLDKKKESGKAMAWGSDKKKKEEDKVKSELNAELKGGVVEVIANDDPKDAVIVKEQHHHHQQQPPEENHIPQQQQHQQKDDTKNSPPQQEENQSSQETTSDQVEFMKKLAKEKALKKRQEEEERFTNQRERAMLRLKELELKMGKTNGGNVSTTNGNNGHDSGNGNGSKQNGGEDAAERRSLYDPLSESAPSYSSLVGHYPSLNPNHPHYNQHQHQHHQGSSSGMNSNIGTEEQVTSSGNGSMPLIHLSSFEYRDRGERSANSGPRMLFDPKSGSMVAAPSGERGGDTLSGGSKGGGGSGGRRDKNSKSLKLSRNGRKDNNYNGEGDEYHNSLDLKSHTLKGKKDKRRDGTKDKKGPNGTNLDRSHKSTGMKQLQKRRKLPRTKGVLYKRDDKGNLVSADGCEGDQGYGAHSVPGGRRRNPKTYALHKKKIQEEKNKYPRNNFSDAHVGSANQVYNGWPYTGYDYTTTDYTTTITTTNATTMQSSQYADYDHIREKPSLNKSHFMKKKNISQPPKVSEEKKDQKMNFDLPSPLRVKPDEKLELLTGVGDSPMLQATAAAWAPSEAALALAAANTNGTQNEKGFDSNNSKSSDNFSESDVHAINAMSFIDDSSEIDDDDDADEEEDDDASDSLRIGLGFDPTKDIDGVMKSPNLIGTDDINISRTKLPDFVYKSEQTATTASNNPFAAGGLLGPSPWGGGVSHSASMGSLSNWDYLRSPDKKEGLEASRLAQSNQDTRHGTSSFLSLSALNGDQNTWGSTGFVSGFGNLGEKD